MYQELVSGERNLKVQIQYIKLLKKFLGKKNITERLVKYSSDVQSNMYIII